MKCRDCQSGLATFGDKCWDCRDYQLGLNAPTQTGSVPGPDGKPVWPGFQGNKRIEERLTPERASKTHRKSYEENSAYFPHARPFKCHKELWWPASKTAPTAGYGAYI